MFSRDLRSVLALVMLAFGVVLLREDHGSITGYVVATSFALIFWYLNELSLALSNLRNIFILSAIFGIVMIAAQLVFPGARESAKMGLSADGDLDPGMIAHLKESHELALDLYFDHKPSAEERYYRVGSLPFTKDGLHYTRKKDDTDLTKLPRAAAWVRTNLTSGLLKSDLEKIRIWFKNAFSYTLIPGSLHSPYPLDEFLFESRKGYCEHYAASLATLLKLRGYQARVDFGYASGHWNPLTRLLTYEESDAHAWVGVFDPVAKEWRTVDPTEWVMPGEILGQSDGMPFWISVLALFLIIGAIVVFVPTRRGGVDALLAKVDAVEHKHNLESAGLTLSERVARIAALYPERAQSMQASLAIYLASYFANAPAQTEKRTQGRS